LRFPGENGCVEGLGAAELAAGARTREGVDEDLSGFERLELDFDSAWRAGVAFRSYRPGKADEPVLPDFFIRAQGSADIKKFAHQLFFQTCSWKMETESPRNGAENAKRVDIPPRMLRGRSDKAT
jgi:hypothetical protein